MIWLDFTAAAVGGVLGWFIFWRIVYACWWWRDRSKS